MRKPRVVLFFILVLIFWKYFSPGIKVAQDYPSVNLEQLRESFNPPFIWMSRGSDMGEYSLLTLWAWPYDLLTGIIAQAGLTFRFVEIFLGIIPIFIIGIYSISKLLEYNNISGYSVFISSFFYLTTSYLILLIDGGQLQIALAYALFPLSFLGVKRGIEGNLHNKIFASLGVVGLGFLDIRFIYLLFLLSIFWVTYDILFVSKNKVHLLKQTFFTGTVIFIVFVGLNFYWILPYIYNRGDSVADSFNKLTSNTFLSFVTWKHVLLLHQPHWFKNVFGYVEKIDRLFVIIPSLVFILPILKVLGIIRLKSIDGKKIIFWIIIAVIGMFLTKGSNPPFGNIYIWLFKNLPGFSIFRDSTKFFFLIALSYSVLIGYSTQSIELILSKLKVKKGIFNKYLPNSTTLIFLIVIYFMLLIRPVYLDKMTGTLSTPAFSDSYSEVDKILSVDKDFGRIFWIPSKTPLGYSSSLHGTTEALRFLDKRPFQTGVVGSYEKFNFLREAPYMGELFDIAAIKYISYPYFDLRRENPKQDNIDYYYTFFDQLTNLPWIERKLFDAPVRLLEVKGQKDNIFSMQNAFMVVGTDEIYQEIYDLNKGNTGNAGITSNTSVRGNAGNTGETSKTSNVGKIRFRDNALVFAEENVGVKGFYDNRKFKLINYDKTDIDITAFISLTGDRTVFPSEYLDNSPNGSGWWKRTTADFLWWRNFLQTKYQIDNQDFDYDGGWAVAENNVQLQISNDKLVKNKLLLARVMKSSKGGRMEFWQKDTKIGEVNTWVNNPKKVEIKLTGYKEIPDQLFLYDKAEFNWYEIGILITDETLEIRSYGDINVVNSIGIIDSEIWKTYKDKVRESVENGNIVNWNNINFNERRLLMSSDSKVRIDYKKINPTQYRLHVTGVSKPTVIAFSENYNNYWFLGKNRDYVVSASFPLYSLINGFMIDEDGDYFIYFYPQKYVYPGLVVSGAVFILIMYILFRYFSNLKRDSSRVRLGSDR